MTFQDLMNLFETSPILNVVGLIFVFNTALAIIEIALDFFTKKERRWKDTGANITIFFMGEILQRTALGAVGVVCLLPFQYLSPFEIPIIWWTWILAILAADFTYYWMHRLEHEHRFLWALHSVHHSSQDFNLTVAFRLSIVEGLIEWAFLVPMVLAGFSPFQTILALVFVAQYQAWIHTERVRKMGWLDEVFNTPSVHRVHHGSNEKYLDKNYGGILIIWDKMFDTFQREEEEVRYGLTKNIKTNNPIKINFIEFVNIWNDLKRCKTLKDKFKIIFGGLTWRPKYFREYND